MIDFQHTAHGLSTLQSSVRPDPAIVPCEVLAQGGIQGVLNQCAFPRARHTGDGNERTQGQAHVDLFQIVFARPLDGQPDALLHGALATRLTLMPAIVQVVPGERGGMLGQFLERPGGHHVPALRASARTEVDDMISPADGLLIVLHHHNAVALVLQTVQRTEQARVVEGVQTDGRLVQDITHATQVRAQLGGQTQTLGLTARQRIAATIERQVAQANLLHALQAGDDFWQQRLGNGALARIEGEFWHAVHRSRH